MGSTSIDDCRWWWLMWSFVGSRLPCGMRFARKCKNMIIGIGSIGLLIGVVSHVSLSALSRKRTYQNFVTVWDSKFYLCYACTAFRGNFEIRYDYVQLPVIFDHPNHILRQDENATKHETTILYGNATHHTPPKRSFENENDQPTSPNKKSEKKEKVS